MHPDGRGSWAHKQGILAPGAPRPPTLPVVIHNGATPWGAHRRLADLPGAGLRKTAYDWIRRRARHNFGIELGLLEDEDMSVGVFRSRIDENMKRATEAWYNDGLNDGLNQGRTEGHRLLAQQARTRFGRAAEARLAQALDRGVGPAPAEVADLIVTCDSAEEFAARLDAGAAAGPRPDSGA